MVNKKYVVELSVDERAALSGMIKKGKSSAQSNLKARILLKTDQGEAGEHWLDKNICTALHTNMSMVGRVRETCINEGFEAVFVRKKRKTPPITPIFDGEAEARLIALACSEPPQGQVRWTLRLFADKVVERKYELISDEGYNFIWPVDENQSDWNLARLPANEESKRQVDEISTMELRAFATTFQNAVDPVEEIKHALGFARLKTPAKDRIKRAVEYVTLDIEQLKQAPTEPASNGTVAGTGAQDTAHPGSTTPARLDGCGTDPRPAGRDDKDPTGPETERFDGDSKRKSDID